MQYGRPPGGVEIKCHWDKCPQVARLWVLLKMLTLEKRSLISPTSIPNSRLHLTFILLLIYKSFSHQRSISSCHSSTFYNQRNLTTFLEKIINSFLNWHLCIKITIFSLNLQRFYREALWSIPILGHSQHRGGSRDRVYPLIAWAPPNSDIFLLHNCIPLYLILNFRKSTSYFPRDPMASQISSDIIISQTEGKPKLEGKNTLSTTTKKESMFPKEVTPWLPKYDQSHLIPIQPP